MCCIVDVFKAGGDWKLAVTTNGVAVEPHTVTELSPYPDDYVPTPVVMRPSRRWT